MEFTDWKNNNPKILIVDDLGSARKIISKFLTKIGLTNIVEATNGEEALDLIQKEKINIVISDWEMPKLNGLDLFKNLPLDEETRPQAFIMVTSHSVKEKVLSALEMGVSDYVLKPFDEKILESKLTKIAEKF
jgi:two-component system chemotaxis response regulator CheY